MQRGLQLPIGERKQRWGNMGGDERYFRAIKVPEACICGGNSDIPRRIHVQHKARSGGHHRARSLDY